MEDEKIVELYFLRDESAISQTLLKYKNYCEAIAYNIIENKEDTEECINSSMLDVWNSIPPAKPENLRVYIGKIVKNNALNIYKKAKAEKRGGNNFTAISKELSELASGASVEKIVEQQEIVKAVNDYLKTMPEKKRTIFILRYWHCCEVSNIAGAMGITEANVYNILKRERKKLMNYLKKRGVIE